MNQMKEIGVGDGAGSGGPKLGVSPSDSKDLLVPAAPIGAPKRRQRGASVDVGVRSIQPVPLAELTGHLNQLGRERRMHLKMQRKLVQMANSYVLQFALKPPPSIKGAKMQPYFKEADRLRKAIECGGGEVQWRSDAESVLIASDLAAVTPYILAFAGARKVFDDRVAAVHNEMELLAEQLPEPVLKFITDTRGLGVRGLAWLVGECGDLSNYASKERLWKRLGYAVIGNKRQGDAGKGASAEVWLQHGYSPGRHGEAWSFFNDVLLRAQWRREKDGVAAHAIGPYGEVYGKARAKNLAKEGVTPAHAGKMARREMAKASIKDLWRCWRASTRSVEAING